MGSRIISLPDAFRNARSSIPVALIVIDVQFDFCSASGARGTEHTEKIAHNIQDTVKDFRDRGVPVYSVYYASDGSDTGRKNFGGFHIYEPDFKRDVIIEKDQWSFASKDILEHFEKRGIHRFFFMGFNENACVHESAVDIGQNMSPHLRGSTDRNEFLYPKSKWYTGLPAHASFIYRHVGNGRGTVYDTFDKSSYRKESFGFNYCYEEEALAEIDSLLLNVA